MNGSVLKGITSLTLISLLTGGFLRDFDPNDLPFSASNTINLHGSEYVLQEDLTTDTTFLEVSAFDLNGYTLTFTGTDNPLLYVESTDLTIRDSSEGKTGKIYSQNGATIIDGRSSTDTAKITIESGSIQGSGNLGSSAITVGKGDSFYMNGGTICDFKADNGAAVYAEACWFEMKAGTIRNCQATENGGAIAYSLAISGGQVVPMFMNGGSITECSAKNGGAIYCEGYLAISGELTYNSASENGGAVYIKDYDVVGYLRLDGCSVEYNTSNGLGGGIYFLPSERLGALSVNNSAVVKGNYNVSGSTPSEDNLYLAGSLSTPCIFDTITDDCHIGFNYAGMKDGDVFASAFTMGGIEIGPDGSAIQTSISNGAEAPVFLFPDDHDFYVEKVLVGENSADMVIREGEKMRFTRLDCYLQDGALGMKIKLYVPSDIDLDDVSATFKIGDKEPVSIAPVGGRDGSGEITFSCPIKASEFTKPVSLSVSLDGAPERGASVSGITIKNYARLLYENPLKYTSNSSENQKRFIASLMIYASAAQQYFKINTDNLADDFINNELKAATEAYDLTSDPFLEEQYFNLNETEGSPIHLYGASMIFESEIAMKYYITYDAGTDISKVKINIDGTEYTPTKVSGNYLCVKVSNIKIGLLWQPTHIEAMYDGVTTATMDYSPYTYLVRIAEKTTDPNMAYLCKAIYLYYRASLNYFH